MQPELSPLTWQLWCFAALSLAMMIAVESDLRNQRIPNVLVLLMLVTGVALNVMGPANGRAGLFAHFPGALGLQGALLGVVAGFALLLPLYMFQAMGAGDVKLMAGLGSFVGPVEVLSLTLTVFAIGGVLSLLRMLWLRNFRLVFSNVMRVLSSMADGPESRFNPAIESADRMPYALAFAGGLLAYGYWRLHGGAPFISL
jgi:prepilin peptidase CpaA